MSGNLSLLVGLQVRGPDHDGPKGRIFLSEEDSSLWLAWRRPGFLAPACEPLVEIFGLEALTLGEGWVPLASLLEKAKTDQRSSDGSKAPPTGSHDPFKYRDRLGMGPKHQSLKKTGDWNCRCNNYKCSCTGPGGTKKDIKTDPTSKKRYNRDYMDFLQGRSSGLSKSKKSKKLSRK